MSEKPTYEELEKRVRELEEAEAARKKTEDALHEAEKRFRAIYEQAPLGIAVIDSKTGRFLHINDAYCKIIGYPRAEMLEMDFMRITHPDDLQEDLDNMTRLRAGDISRFQMEKRYFRKDGALVWASLTVVPLWEDSADPLHHIAIVEDITEKKRAEQELRESWNKYHTLFESANDAIFVACAQTGILLDANQQAEKITGRSKAEIIGAPFAELHPPEQQAQAQAHFKDDIKQKGKPVYHDLTVQNKNGREIPVEISPSHIEIQGAPCLLGIFRDVSEKKKTETALIESEKRFRAIFHNEHVVMMIIDPDTGAIQEANPAAAAFYGWSHEELTRMNIKQINILAPGEIENEMQAALRKRRHLFHFRHRLKDGRLRDVEVASGPVNYGGKAFLYSILQDVSKRKQAEEALKESESNLKKSQKIAKIGNYQTNLKENYWTGSDEFYRIFGLPKKERYTQEEFQELVHPDDFDDVMAYFNECIRERKPFNYQYRCIRRDAGDVIFVQSTSDITYDDDGTPDKIFGIKQDITVQKKAELALKESEARFRAIFEQAAAGISTAAPDGRILDANQTMCDMLGYTRKELVRKTVYDITFPEDMELQRRRMQAVVEGKQNTFQIEKRFLHKNGRQIWVHHSSNVVRNERGAIEYAIGVAADITDRKQTEEALKTSERKFKNIAENMPGKVLKYKMNPDGGEELLYVSKGVEKLYEISRDEALKNPRLLWERIHKEDRDLFFASVKKSAENQSLWESEYRVVMPDGRIKWVQGRGVPVKLNDGSVIWDTLGIDITEQKQAEQALKESEARFRAIFEQAAAGIAAATPDGSIVEVNQTLCDMLGYAREELRRLSVTDITHPEDLEREMAIKQAVIARQQDIFNIEKRYLHKEGHPVWANLSSSILRDEKGNIRYAIGVAVDITKRKNAEQALRDALAEKEVLLREIHHRVKNNMQVITGLLRMHARRTEDEHVTQIFNNCRDRIEAMSMIHEALYQSDDLAHIDFEKYLNKLCRHLARAHGAGGKGVALTVSAVDVSLSMDQGIAVGMIIAELISNAFKHAFPHEAGAGGAVTVRLDRVDDETVRLAVSDTGKGLPPDFDIQAPTSLGLRLVAGAVTRELGGDIRAEKDGGTRFVIRFRRRRNKR